MCDCYFFLFIIFPFLKLGELNREIRVKLNLKGNHADVI